MGRDEWLPMLADIFEPCSEIVPLLQQSIPVEVANLNLGGYADYFWTAIDKHTVQMERKQGGEALASLSKVEDQLRRQYDKADENHLVVENFIVPSRKGCSTLRNKGKLFYIDRVYEHVTYMGWLKWCYSLDKAGITVHTTPDLNGTASLLVALYTNAQNPDHPTLNRYIKQKIYIEEQNPHVLSLMGLRGVNLGEVRARALIERYETLWGVLIRTPEELMEVEGIGRKLAHDILKSAGRNG